MRAFMGFRHLTSIRQIGLSRARGYFSPASSRIVLPEKQSHLFVTPSSAALRSMRFHLDIGSSDDRPPLLDLGLLVGAERGWCLLLASRDHQPEIGQAFAHVCI